MNLETCKFQAKNQRSPCHPETFEGIDTLTLQVRYDMPSKVEADLWTSIKLVVMSNPPNNPHQSADDLYNTRWTPKEGIRL